MYNPAGGHFTDLTQELERESRDVVCLRQHGRCSLKQNLALRKRRYLRRVSPPDADPPMRNPLERRGAEARVSRYP